MLFTAKKATPRIVNWCIHPDPLGFRPVFAYKQIKSQKEGLMA
jgi:hypothetical protein